MCLETIDKHTAEALSAEGFVEIDLDTFCCVLERDTLRIREVQLFTAACRWSAEECRRQHVPVSQTTLRILKFFSGYSNFSQDFKIFLRILKFLVGYSNSFQDAQVSQDTQIHLRDTQISLKFLCFFLIMAFFFYLKVTPENQRQMLGRALMLIRFPLMTIEEFANSTGKKFLNFIIRNFFYIYIRDFFFASSLRLWDLIYKNIPGSMQ